MRNVVIFGGSSTIASYAARHFAIDGDRILLIGRDEKKLQKVQQDLLLRGASQCETIVSELSDTALHSKLMSRINETIPEMNTVLFAYGSLSNQKEIESSPSRIISETNVNYVSAISLITQAAELLQNNGGGLLGAISSVAGDRGRRNNYIYGAAKAGLTTFLSGLRARMFPFGVSITTIKAGLIDTAMTAHIADKRGFLWSEAEYAGKKVYQAIVKKKALVYVPWFWRSVMLVFKMMPEVLFRKIRF